MLLIEDGVIYITRGDDAEIEVDIRDGEGTPYTLEEGSKLVLTVREKPEATSEILLRIESDSNRIALPHEDTTSIAVGRYSADIELRIGNLIYTIWPELEGSARYAIKNYRNFVIMPEVTR